MKPVTIFRGSPITPNEQEVLKAALKEYFELKHVETVLYIARDEDKQLQIILDGEELRHGKPLAQYTLGDPFVAEVMGFIEGYCWRCKFCRTQ